ELMLRCEEWIWDAYPKSKEIKIMAQCYLEQWYGRQGYVGQGEEFLEDGIPHRIMVKPTL
ncbi:MAG: GNAT family N-acetyltransferase, partial [Flavobacteriales bacterium]